MQPRQALQKYFGYKSFRQNQEEIIDAILEGDNVIAVLPTGAGKSICYQIPALVSDNFSIVISPLIALMKDQVDSLNKNGTLAAFINSTMSFYETEEVLRNISFGKIKLLYVAPERLENISFADKIKSLNPAFLFVDEAHCISEWGHSFRPSYRKIKDFAGYIQIKRISAFTATATPEVVKDILQQLSLNRLGAAGEEAQIFVRGFERDNLELNVVLTRRKKEKCLELLSIFKTPAIIYTASRKRAEEISAYLNIHKIDCAYYHAGLMPEERKKIQEDFLTDKVPVIAATNAFGMGIDKKDIRLVIHYNTPGSIENYYQEIGRAGRDGEISFAFLLHEDNDVNIQNFFLSNSYPDKQLIQNVYDALCDYGQIAVGSMSAKEIPINADYISAFAKKEISKGLLYSALKILEGGGYLKQPSEFNNKSSIKFNLDKDKLKDFTKKTTNIHIKISVLYFIREFGSRIFSSPVQISAPDIAVEIGLTASEIEDVFIILDNLGIIEYKKPLSKENVVLTAPRIVSSRLNLDFKKISQSYIFMESKIERMVDYVYSGECRFKFILQYFGEEAKDYKCGRCDNCKEEAAMPESTVEYIREIILRTLYKANSPVTESSVISIMKGSAKSGIYSSFDTFGACANYDRNELKKILNDSLLKELISRSADSKTLSLTEKGTGYLKAAGLAAEEKKEPAYEDSLELFHLLKEIRKTASNKFMQTGYLICPDEVLREISRTKPVDRKQLLLINGFNQRMFNKIGEEMLETINEFVNTKSTAVIKPAAGEKKNMPGNIKETFGLLKKGYSLSDIASIRQLNEAVVSMQIETILEYEPEVKIDSLYDAGVLEEIFKEISKGYNNLKELKGRLPDNVTYPLIRIAVAKYKPKRND